MAKMPGESVVYRSYDQTTEVSEASGYPMEPMEVLNNQNPPGLPPHELKLKWGCPIILLRNLEAPLLMNGTRLIVKRLMKNIIVAWILSRYYCSRRRGGTVTENRLDPIRLLCGIQASAISRQFCILSHLE